MTNNESVLPAMGDYYEKIRAGTAPRLTVGLSALEELLSDGKWHSRRAAIDAIAGTGLARRTAENLLANLETHSVISSRRGANRRYNTPNGWTTKPELHYRKLDHA